MTTPQTTQRNGSDTNIETRTGESRVAMPGQKAGEQHEGGQHRSSPPVRRNEKAVSNHQLDTPEGKTHIADTVVAKIAACATREIGGVHSMGRGMTRKIGALRAMVPGQSEAITQGVTVEVGEKQAAIDLEIVTWYGESILEVTEAVRRNVIERIEGMCGLEVVEVNIHVDDVHIEDGSEMSSPSEPAQPRVQ